MKNKNTIYEFFNEVWNCKNKETESLYNIFSDNVVTTSPLGKTIGLANIIAIHKEWLHGFPDINVSVSDIISDKNRVISTWVCKGRHINSFNNLEPTNRLVQYSGVTTFEFDNNNIVSYDCYLNMLDIYSQLGAHVDIEKYKNQYILKYNYELLINELKKLHFEAPLSKKEIECICLTIGGCSAKEAAIVFNISPRTIEIHISNAMSKLNISGRYQLRNLIIENNLLHMYRDLYDIIINPKLIL